MNNKTQENNPTEYVNPFAIASEISIMVNTVNIDETFPINQEADSNSIWNNFICLVKPKTLTNHEKLKEVYQDVKKMADAYIKDNPKDTNVKKFII